MPNALTWGFDHSAFDKLHHSQSVDIFLTLKLFVYKLQELQLLSSITLYCQVTISDTISSSQTYGKCSQIDLFSQLNHLISQLLKPKASSISMWLVSKAVSKTNIYSFK